MPVYLQNGKRTLMQNAANGCFEPNVSDAAMCINGSSAQKASFAKFCLFPDSGLSCGVRRKPDERLF